MTQEEALARLPKTCNIYLTLREAPARPKITNTFSSWQSQRLPTDANK
jgi:hypothetical protein